MPYSTCRSVLLAAALVAAAAFVDSLDLACPSGDGDGIMIPDDSSRTSRRYLMFSVNPGEGLNLARDVYARAVALVRELNGGKPSGPWTLVMPPFSNPHWRSQQWSPFSDLFDLDHLQELLPVINLDDFWSHGAFSEHQIDEVLHLSHVDLPAEKLVPTVREVEYPCAFGSDPRAQFTIDDNGLVRGGFWNHGSSISAKRLRCLQVFGFTSTIIPILRNSSSTVIMVARLETLMHTAFGSREFWTVRRGMTFVPELRDLADKYVKNVIGGAFVAVHMRRGDFLAVHRSAVPSIRDTATHLISRLTKYGTKKLFISTNARFDEHDKEFGQLADLLADFQVYFFPDGQASQDRWQLSNPTNNILSESAASIVDQIICTHSVYFIGTKESTFTSTIQTERDLGGIHPSVTHELLCSASNTEPSQEATFNCPNSQRGPPL